MPFSCNKEWYYNRSCCLVTKSCLILLRPHRPQQAPLSIGFPRQEHWSRLSFPSPGDLSNTRTEPASPALTREFFSREAPSIIVLELVTRESPSITGLQSIWFHLIYSTCSKINYVRQDYFIIWFPVALWCLISCNSVMPYQLFYI